MKTKLISLLLSCVILISLAACASENPGSTSEETTRETTAAQTTEEVTTLDDTTAEETTEDTNQLQLNSDVFSSIDLTFEQVKEKYGEATYVVILNENFGYYFEDGYGYYMWPWDSVDFNISSLHLEEGQSPYGTELTEIPSYPNADAKCVRIGNVKAKDLFDGLSNPTKDVEIAELYNIQHTYSGEEGTDGQHTSFTYDNLTFIVHTNEIGIIEPEAMVDIIS